MKSKVLVVLCLGISSIGFSQSKFTGFGIQPKVQSSMHVFEDPTLEPKFRKSATNRLITYGIDAYVDFSVIKNLKLRGKLGYESKGAAGWFDHQNTVHYSKSKLDYLSSDLEVVYLPFVKSKFKPFVKAGLTTGYMIKKDVQTTTSFHTTTYYEDYPNWAFGGSLGLGFDYDNLIYCEIENNRDLVKPVKTTDFAMYNSSLTVNVGLNILELVKRVKAG